MYDAIGTKNPAFEGMFITGVKSTGIFCRPSCRARKPLAKNVEFFRSSEEALKAGYRPCKICRPMDHDPDTPQEIRDLIKRLHNEPQVRIRDQDLRDLLYDPVSVRRWFNKHHNMTFQCYQRLIRLNAGYREIEDGQSVLNTALDAGFESLSGFSERYSSVFGSSPRSKNKKSIIHVHRFSGKLGSMFIAATQKGICLLEFTERKMLETEFDDLRKRCHAVLMPGTNEHIEQLKKELEEYFAGERICFQVKLDLVGTDFQKQVWNCLLNIPYGETISYKQQALSMGRGEAVRAVARANGMNKVAIVVPCHRVIGSDGNLTGYAGGLPRKRWLLDLEASNTTH
ncbi:MAG: methylated-DNA--[protein]-cysteine S-methyltransferase [Pseudobacteriovorax sp.]|nr:methylated-DNA--[protein]-cysteine S-methyltransferase [Pseudobacteriovorax sp.]